MYAGVAAVKIDDRYGIMDGAPGNLCAEPF